MGWARLCSKKENWFHGVTDFRGKKKILPPLGLLFLQNCRKKNELIFINSNHGKSNHKNPIAQTCPNSYVFTFSIAGRRE